MFSLLTKGKGCESLSVWSVCEVSPRWPQSVSAPPGDSVSRLSHPLQSVLAGREEGQRCPFCRGNGALLGCEALKPPEIPKAPGVLPVTPDSQALGSAGAHRPVLQVRFCYSNEPSPLSPPVSQTLLHSLHCPPPCARETVHQATEGARRWSSHHSEWCQSLCRGRLRACRVLHHL